MTPDEPSHVRLSDHVHARAPSRRIGVDLVEAVVLEEHHLRRRDPGRADWRLEARGIVVLYDWPHGADPTTAFVRSVWRR
jgi:hypothetical protein